jgi:hypothetical protein
MTLCRRLADLFAQLSLALRGPCLCFAHRAQYLGVAQRAYLELRAVPSLCGVIDAIVGPSVGREWGARRPHNNFQREKAHHEITLHP